MKVIDEKTQVQLALMLNIAQTHLLEELHKDPGNENLNSASELLSQALNGLNGEPFDIEDWKARHDARLARGDDGTPRS